MKALSILTACAALLTGCTSFEPLRSTRFVDDNNNYLHVDYGRDTKDHESTAVLENGVSWPFKSKNMVRVELPDGTRCATVRNPANATRSRRRTGGSTPSGFGRDANGPRDVTNEKK